MLFSKRMLPVWLCVLAVVAVVIFVSTLGRTRTETSAENTALYSKSRLVVGVVIYSFTFAFKMIKMFYLSKYRFPAHYLMNNCMYTKHNEYQVINFKVSHRNKDEASTGDVQVQHKNLRFHCVKLIRTHFSIHPLNLMEIFSQCLSILKQQETRPINTLLK